MTSPQTPRRIGFIGLGHMGHPMADNLLAAGHDLVVSDIRREAAAGFTGAEPAWADTPAAVAREVEVVFLSLPGPAEVERVVAGQDGVLGGAREGATIVDLSTNSPTVARRLAAQCAESGVVFVDAPVSGGVAGARHGDLTVMMGGPAPAIEAIRPLIDILGKQVFHVGEAGTGNVAKLINNMLAIINMLTTAEALVLGEKAGIDLAVLREVITSGSGRSPIFEHGSRRILADQLAPSFTVGLGEKDLSLAVAMAQEFDVDVPVGASAAQALRRYHESGLESEDMFAVVKALEEQANVVVRGKAADV